jgi:hypothetical protein
MKGFFEICIVIFLVVCFFIYQVYGEVWFWVVLGIVILVSVSEFVRHYVFQLLAVVFGALYLSSNMFLTYVTKQIEPFKHEDRVVYAIFRILFFPLQVIVTIFSIPYEWVLSRAH